MTRQRKDSITSHMKQRTNDELSDISVKTNSNEYSKESFDIIYNTLLKRGENVSPQTKHAETIKKEEINKMTLRKFFSFEFMMSSKLIQSAYIVGAFAVTMISWILFMRNELIIGLLSIIIGNLFWRLACEVTIIFFNMHEQLGSIHQELKRSIDN